jgi:preprotein translocase subunit SecG
MGKSDFKEKLIIAGFLIGIFLPIRLVFVEYVSDQWLGNFGLISAIGLILLILIKKGKLGKIGSIFDKQMKKTIFGKTGKFVIILSMISLVYFGSSMMFIERGVTVYSEDQELFYDAIIQNKNLDQINPNNLKNIHIVYESDNLLYSTFDYAFSITYSIMNEFSGGWLEHLYFILLVELIEVLGIFTFYRVFYRPVISISV